MSAAEELKTTMVAFPRPLTYADLVEMPDDGKRREIIGGELIVSPAPTAGHQDVVANLHILLHEYAREHGGHIYLAPFDVVLGRYDVVQPDLLYISASRPRVPLEKHALEEPPDLVVEVVSPGTGWIDRTRKMALYATFGVPEFWITDPVRRVVVVHVLQGEEYSAVEPDADGLIPSQALAALRVDPKAVFSGLE
jgi:Uma2 family endonuclease